MNAVVAASAVCLLAAGSTTLAAEAKGPVGADDIDELESIIVTATRLPIRAFAVPAMAYSESAADIQGLYQSRTLPEALGEVPGVLVQKTSNGQGSPFIRGFTGFRNVLLIDGIRLNNSVFRDGPNQYWNTVDTFAASRIEVLKGPASVLYGSDAIGGAVNVLSDIPGTTKPGFSPRVLYRYSNAESSDTIRGDLTYVDERLRATGGYTYKSYGDVEGGGSVGVQPRTGYDEQAANARVEYELSSRSTLLLGYQYVNQDDAWRTHRTIYGNGWNGTTIGTDRELVFDQQRQLGYVQLRQADLGAFADTMLASASYQSQGEDQHRVRSNLRSDELGFDVYTTGLWVQFDKQWGRTRLMYGADYYGDDVTSYNVEYNADGSIRRVHAQGPVADDATYDLTGLFLQAIVQATPKVALTLAGRYTWASTDANKVEDPVTFAVYKRVRRLGQLLRQRPAEFHAVDGWSMEPVRGHIGGFPRAESLRPHAPRHRALRRTRDAEPGPQARDLRIVGSGRQVPGRTIRGGGRVLQYRRHGRDHPHAHRPDDRGPARGHQDERGGLERQRHRVAVVVPGDGAAVALYRRHVDRRLAGVVPERDLDRYGQGTDRPADAGHVAFRRALDRSDRRGCRWTSWSST